MVNRLFKRCCGFSFLKKFKEGVIQRLPTFNKALRDNQRKAYLIEEKKCRERLGFKRLTMDAYEKLVKDSLIMAFSKNKDTQDVGSRMEGVHTYNILANPTWYEKYMYMPYTVPNRDEYIVSMYTNKEMKKWSLDIVRYVCDLAYVPSGRAKAMEFNPEYLHFEAKRRQNDKTPQ